MARTPMNLDGQVFNRLTVLGISDRRNSYNRLLYKCVCECGNGVFATASNLKRGEVKECGACAKLTTRRKDITGQRFGRLVALEIAEPPKGKATTWRWRCQCDCGNVAIVNLNGLTSGNTTSCGCLVSDNIKSLFVDGTSPPKLKESMGEPRASNTSGITGVWWDKSKNLWVAEIMFKKQKHFLGRFSRKHHAAAARKRAEKRLFGQHIQEWDTKQRERDRTKRIAKLQEDPEHMRIPRAIEAARKKKGFARDQLADKVGYNSKYRQAIIYNWERGERPVPKERLQPLADALDLSLEDLLQ